MAYSSPDPLSANWSYDSAIDLFSLNTMLPEPFPMDIPNDMLWDAKDLPADFFAAPTDFNGFTVSHDDSLSSDQESDDQSLSPTNLMSSASPSALDLPSPIQTIQPSQTQTPSQTQPKRKASSISTSASASTRYSSSPELTPQPSTSTRKPRTAATRTEDPARGRNAAKRAAHNIIEKRYRTNMNAKFVALEKAMAVKTVSKSKPSSTSTSTSMTANGSAKSSASLKKSEILSNAITYMHELQEANERLRREIAVMRGERRGFS
ncbi:hypothetical protein BDW62DRAFT_206197 [Aspergillus aurantiobrunneus]